MKKNLMAMALLFLSPWLQAADLSPSLQCENLHDHSSQFELSGDQKTAALTIFAEDSQKTFQMECSQLESENFSVGCQDSGMPSIYQVIVMKTQDRAFLYEYGLESAVIMSDLHCAQP